MATPQELDRFLAGSEKRAYKQALFGCRDEQAALDIVQDSMMKLALRYGDRPAEELPMLFQRILQNTLHDHYRRSKVRQVWQSLRSLFGPREEEDEDPFDAIADQGPSSIQRAPEQNLEQQQTLRIIETEISRLPARQREAFLMRYWEDMDVAETAQAMGCSEGSVKTHCHRATHTLAEALEKKGIKP